MFNAQFSSIARRSICKLLLEICGKIYISFFYFPADYADLVSVLLTRQSLAQICAD